LVSLKEPRELHHPLGSFTPPKTNIGSLLVLEISKIQTDHPSALEPIEVISNSRKKYVVIIIIIIIIIIIPQQT